MDAMFWFKTQSRTKCESLVSRSSRDRVFVSQPRRAKRVLVASSLCDRISSISNNHFLKELDCETIVRSSPGSFALRDRSRW